MRLNNSVFQWHFRMPEVFEEHKKIINANRLQYENSLKVQSDSIITLTQEGIPMGNEKKLLLLTKSCL